MKKKIMTLSLLFTSIIALIMMMPGVYANAKPILLEDGTTANVVEIISTGGLNGALYIDGVVYDPAGYGTNDSLRGFIDEYSSNGNNFKVTFSNNKLVLENGQTADTIELVATTGLTGILYVDGSVYDPAGYGTNGSLQGFIDEFSSNGNNFTLRKAVSPDNVRPAISGEENFVTSVDQARPISFFQAYLSAIDETDGDLTSSIYIVSDNYTPNKLVLGSYKVVFGVKDASNNESTLEITITVADVTKPVITGNTSPVSISYTQTWNVANFKSTLSVTDNYATLTNSNIAVKSDQYTSNKTVLGTYNVVYSATDPSGNEGTFTKTITVIDDIAPVFSGPTTINKPLSSILTVNEIKAQLTATDVKDGNRTSNIQVQTDNYTGHGNKVGSYTIVFSVEDSKGNQATHTVTVVVQDNIPPVWYIQDGVSVKLVPPTALTRNQIIDLLVATGQLQIGSTTQINFLVDEYQGNETTPGVYIMSLTYSDTSGNEGVHNFSITVLEDENETPIVLEPEVNFIDQVWSWMQSNPIQSLLLGIGLLLTIISFLAITVFKK